MTSGHPTRFGLRGWLWARVLDRLVPSQAEIDALIREHMPQTTTEGETR